LTQGWLTASVPKGIGGFAVSKALSGNLTKVGASDTTTVFTADSGWLRLTLRWIITLVI
jgi:hypothetical protein